MRAHRKTVPLLGLGMLAGLCALAGCADDDAPAADAGPPDAFVGEIERCPGGPACATAEGALEVGVGAADLTPDLSRWESEFTDTDGDHCWDEGDEPFVDEDGNGKFEPLWLAGFCSGRPATAIETPLAARAMAFRQGETSMAIVYVDTIGLFDRAIAAITDDPAVQALGFDLVIVGATHNHEAPDTVGLYHEDQLRSGVDDDYREQVRAGAVAALVQAAGSLTPATMTVAQVLAIDPATGAARPYVSDARDPMIFDPTLTLVHFRRADAEAAPIGTLVNFAAHPEYTGDRNGAVSGDYPHWLRTVIEDGFAEDGVVGLGGTAVFVQGPLGGQVGPIHAAPVGPEGPITEAGHEKAKWGGIRIAELGLRALEDAGEAVAAPALSFRTLPIIARVDNTALTFAGLTGVIDHTLVGYDTDKPIGPGNEAWVPTRLSVVQVGPVAFVTAPGELHPELWVGGYACDGCWSWGQDLLPEPINAPDLDLAPAPPYLRDELLANPGVKYVFVAGLAHDFVGYIVAEFNFLLSESSPYFEEAEGEHYEETNSLGPDAELQIVGRMFELVRARP